MKILSALFFFCIWATFLTGQSLSISGIMQESSGEGLPFANVALYDESLETLIKVEVTDDKGAFTFPNLSPDTYQLKASYVGFNDIVQRIELGTTGDVDLGILQFEAEGIELQEAVVTARRAMVEVKPDRTVFNVEGTINSVGSDAISLLRKAPGVTVDNNDNVTVLGRSGVLLYVDGKRLPLTGEDLNNYLRTLTAEQIDRIDIISNPGAKYEAEGNAGIIDIRLKKSNQTGANGTISGSYSKGRHARGFVNGSGNLRKDKFNLFGSGGYFKGKNYNVANFKSRQNGISLLESNDMIWKGRDYGYRGGMDFYLDKHNTFGVVASGKYMEGNNAHVNKIVIGTVASGAIDSILIANNTSDFDRTQHTYNFNYRYVKDDQTLNVDLDYGAYRNKNERFQPNQYYNASEEVELSKVVNSFDTPSDIDISTFKLDYENTFLGGTLGAGVKLSKVVSDNTFIFNNVIDDQVIRDDQRSNIFKYDEKVYAAYLSYAGSISEKVKYTLGMRTEQTDAQGDLRAFAVELNEPPVILEYLSWFPNAGMTWHVSDQHLLSLNYGRRINRPDYNVLNPFNFQLSVISFEKGNPFLRPEIVNNIELGYTLNSLYNFKLSYSRTVDQITRLIGPDEIDARANFITWENLASQKVFNFNLSAPVDITEKWNVYSNLGISHIANEADYGNGAIVDLTAFSYNLFQQHTITLPAGFKGEVSGFYSGPGIWGGVFKYNSSWSLNFGLQKKLMNDQINVKLAMNDVFYESGWDGVSEFNGLISEGGGNWDSRRGSISVSYNFGNQNLKSKVRKTGLDEEASRVGEGNS